MKIFLNNLRGDKLELQIEPSMTVAEVKQLIASQHGHDPALQKLISSGRILEDPKAMSEYSVNEGDTIVIMVSKPKPTAQAQPARPVPQPSVSSGPSSRLSQPSGAPSENASTLVTGEAYEEAVTRIVDMGFERSQVQQAMRAAFNNPDRAIEYLFSGIPEEPRPSAPSSSHHAPSPVSSPGHSEVMSDNPLAFLLSNPMFLQLRTMIQQNPSILPQLLQQLQQSNPQLLTLISQNQDAFMSLINDPLPEGAAPQIDRKDQTASLIAGLPRPRNPRNVISVSPEEAESIQRLSDLGFAQRDALEAFLACDRNEAMAANLLFDNYMTVAAQENEAAIQASLGTQPPPSVATGSSLASPQPPQEPGDEDRKEEHPDQEHQE
jgi:UV excision repair protein RAD23